MKIFLWYAGVLAACYVASLAYVLIFRRSGQGANDASTTNAVLDLLVFVGLSVLAALIIGGGAAIVLWRRFVLQDASVPQLLWILSALILLSMVKPAVSGVGPAIRHVRAMLSSDAQDNPAPTANRLSDSKENRP
jgi:hypothetical protein